MRYISTRGGIKPIKFTDTVFEGLSPDGGLFLPEEIPTLSEYEIEQLKGLSYIELALTIFNYFIDDIPQDDLKKIVSQAYSRFRTKDVVGIKKVKDIYILELFYGPTFAFKDIALQFLGELFEYLLLKTGKKINILGATSGDTGSAAIYGVKGKKNICIFILYPYKKVSYVQELMMTTVLDKNVFNLAIKGNFDDCQCIVKNIFMDLEFKKRLNLTAINSINWARLLAQVVYYIWAYLKVSEKEGEKSVRFSVPTGNFGNIFAGYIAKKMLGKERIERFILATNENDILSRFVNNGDYSVREVKSTISPSMDIQVASNFERYLYYLYGEDAEKTKKAMEVFKTQGKLKFSEDELQKVREDFLSGSATEEEVLNTIKDFYEETGYLLDPHTAVGVKVGLEKKDDYPLICLATAHYSKFPDTVEKAINKKIELPEEILKLYSLPQRYEILSPNDKEVKIFLEKHGLI